MEARYIILKELAGNAPPTLNELQKIMAPHTHSLIVFWIAVWIFTVFIVVLYVAREYRAQRDTTHSE